jgi:hypothetical protein
MVDHGVVNANTEYLTDLAFPRNAVANRAQPCDERFVGGVTGTSCRSAGSRRQLARPRRERIDRDQLLDTIPRCERQLPRGGSAAQPMTRRHS